MSIQKVIAFLLTLLLFFSCESVENDKAHAIMVRDSIEHDISKAPTEEQAKSDQSEPIKIYDNIRLYWMKDIGYDEEIFEEEDWQRLHFDTLSYGIRQKDADHWVIERLKGYETIIYDFESKLDSIPKMVLKPDFERQADAPIYIISGIPLFEQEISSADIVGETFLLSVLDRLGDSLRYDLNGKPHYLYTRGKLNDEGNPKIKEFEIVFSDGTNKQVIYTHDIHYFPTAGLKYVPTISIPVVADLDSDKQLDLILMDQYTMGCGLHLYLSSQAPEGQLLKEVATLSACLGS